MATVRTWTGGGDGTSWASAANWSPSDDYPKSTDTAILDDTDGTVAGSDQTGVALAAIYVTSRFSGTLGSSGTPLTIAATEMNIKGRGSAIYIEPTSVTRALINVSTESATAVVLGGASASLGVVVCGGGRLTIPSGTTMGSHMTCDFDPFATVPPYITIASGVSFTANENLVCNHGIMKLSQAPSASTRIVVSGGQFWHAGGDISGPDIISVNGGIYRWSAGNIGTMYLGGNGMLDGRGSSTARTLTALYAMGNAVADLRTGSGAVTLSAGFAFGNAVIYEDEI